MAVANLGSLPRVIVKDIKINPRLSLIWRWGEELWGAVQLRPHQKISGRVKYNGTVNLTALEARGQEVENACVGYPTGHFARRYSSSS